MTATNSIEPADGGPAATVASRFNVAVPAEDGRGVLLFNTATRGLLQVDRAVYEALAPLFLDGRRGVPQDYRIPVPDGLDPKLVGLLADNGFLVPDGRDELAELRAAFQHERDNRALYYTVGMTMACNFDCPYCFEEHLPIHMDRTTADGVHDFMMGQARRAQAESLFVSWFGGEPLLVPDVLVYLSGRLGRSCRELGVHYDSYVITNGALLDRQMAVRLVEGGIPRAQVTIDGPKEVHDRRRYFRGGQGSFDRILANLVAVKGILSVVVRVNTDQDNAAHLGELIQILRAEGLLDPPMPIQVYASAVVPYTEQARMLWKPLDVRAASALEMDVRSELAEAGASTDRGIRSNTLLEANRGGCNAMHHHSFVIGPRGHLFKCELGIHDERESVGTVFGAPIPAAGGKRRLPVLAGSKALDWTGYNPFNNQKCQSCQFVPVCKGGCPKQVLEHNQPFMDATCAHWDANFPRLLREAAQELG